MMRLWTRALLGGVFCAAAAAQAPDLSRLDIVTRAVPDGPVATVLGSHVMPGEFIDFYETELELLERRKGEPASDIERLELGLQCLGALIEQEALFHEARRRGLTVPGREVEEAWQAELEMMQRAFSDGGPPASEAEILERAGVTREQALAAIRKVMLVEEMRKTILRDENVRVSDAEVREFYEQNRNQFRRPEQCHIKQIYIKVDQPSAASLTPAGPNSRDNARRRAEDALNRINAGQTFEAVARDMSDGVKSEEGGDLGMMPAHALPPFLVEAAAKLTPDYVSGIIESEYGFHIVKLVAFEGGAEPAWIEVEPAIREVLVSRKGAPVVRAFTQKLTEADNALIVYLDLMRQVAFRPDLREQLAERLGE